MSYRKRLFLLALAFLTPLLPMAYFGYKETISDSGVFLFSFIALVASLVTWVYLFTDVTSVYNRLIPGVAGVIIIAVAWTFSGSVTVHSDPKERGYYTDTFTVAAGCYLMKPDSTNSTTVNVIADEGTCTVKVDTLTNKLYVFASVPNVIDAHYSDDLKSVVMKVPVYVQLTMFAYDRDLSGKATTLPDWVYTQYPLAVPSTRNLTS